MGREYRILEVSQGVYELYEKGSLLAKFTQKTFREELDRLGRSSQWIGCILRQLNSKYPLACPPRFESALARVESIMREKGLADYLRSKGLRVVRQLKAVSDMEVIERLESLGYVIEGLVDGAYYSSLDKK